MDIYGLFSEIYEGSCLKYIYSLYLHRKQKNKKKTKVKGYIIIPNLYPIKKLFKAIFLKINNENFSNRWYRVYWL